MLFGVSGLLLVLLVFCMELQNHGPYPETNYTEAWL